MPLQTLSAFTLSPMYLGVYYNQECLIAAPIGEMRNIKGQIGGYLQAYGLIGYFYLIFFGMIAVAGMLALRGNAKRRVLYGILAFIVALSLSYVAMVLGFLYISASLHDQILANGGNSHAEKNQ